MHEKIVFSLARSLDIANSEARELLELHNCDEQKAIASYRKSGAASAASIRLSLGSSLPTGKKSNLKHTRQAEEDDIDFIFCEPGTPREQTKSSGDLAEWDFVLPRLSFRGDILQDSQDADAHFSLDEAVRSIQNGQGHEEVQTYLRSYPPQEVRAHINGDVAGFPAMFYVVETRNVDLVRLWRKHGGDPNASASSGCLKNVPLLAYAVSLGVSFKTDTTQLVATLLSMGASHTSIPRALYSPCARDLPQQGLDDEELEQLSVGGASWCNKVASLMLASRLNLEQRYYLHIASQLRAPGIRAKQAARAKHAENLFAVPFVLIGQTTASELLIKTLVHHLAKPAGSPLVLVFAGPSGHGKTELARQLGELMSFDMEVVDCTNKNYEEDLFGARNPYSGWAKGSPLNNFLAQRTGRTSIAFLDEFEKMPREVQKALLLPFDSGEYEDRRSRAPVDCSRTIWILATNTFDKTIHEFCDANPGFLSDSKGTSTSNPLAKRLCKTLRVESIAEFGAPLTGRITEFVPFLTFSAVEQAVVAYRNLREAGMQLPMPVVTSSEGPQQRLVGNIDLRVARDYSTCRIIAETEYVQQLGARSLFKGVKRLVESEVLEHYLSVDDEIVQGQDVATYRVESTEDDDIQVYYDPQA